MTAIPPPEEATSFLGAPATYLAVAQLLQNGALEGGFVFVGPEGQGKATLAFMLAATVLSGGQELGAIDPKVRSLIAAGAHPDLKVLRRQPNERGDTLRDEIDVATARRAIEALHHTSTTGRMVVIIDLADELRREAANALLKVLEEPPHGAALFLLSRSISRLLPTLTSRCRRVALRPVNEEPLAKWLRTRADIPEEAARQLARESGGAPGKALRRALGEGDDAAAIADAFLGAVAGQGDLLRAARAFAGKGQEDTAAEAVGLILHRLEKEVVAPGLERETLARRLASYDIARATFHRQGTADPTQTALIAGFRMRDALAGRTVRVR